MVKKCRVFKYLSNKLNNFELTFYANLDKHVCLECSKLLKMKNKN